MNDGSLQPCAQLLVVFRVGQGCRAWRILAFDHRFRRSTEPRSNNISDGDYRPVDGSRVNPDGGLRPPFGDRDAREIHLGISIFSRSLLWPQPRQLFISAARRLIVSTIEGRISLRVQNVTANPFILEFARDFGRLFHSCRLVAPAARVRYRPSHSKTRPSPHSCSLRTVSVHGILHGAHGSSQTPWFIKILPMDSDALAAPLASFALRECRAPS